MERKRLVSILLLAGAIWACSSPAPIAATPSPPSSAAQPTSEAPSLEDQMAQVDAALRQTVDASIAYNKPEAMGLNETATVELLMNPSLTPDVLSTQLTEPGSAASTSIQITPRMKATLMADDQTAFDIRPIHDNPEQFVSEKETTKWSWLVTARKGGNQGLTLTIDRLLQVQGIDQWREVETYKANIEVKVTFVQTLQTLDWKWIIGLIIPLIGVPSLWQYLNSRKKKGKAQGK